MRPIVFKFLGGDWDGETLRTDSADREERFLAAGCYEMCHHGTIGEECVGLSEEEVAFAQKHGWATAKNTSSPASPRYRVAERRETKAEIIVRFEYEPTAHP